MFRSISLPDNLVSQIEQIIEETNRYRSIAEFVCEAVRLRLESLGRLDSLETNAKKEAS